MKDSRAEKLSRSSTSERVAKLLQALTYSVAGALILLVLISGLFYANFGLSPELGPRKILCLFLALLLLLFSPIIRRIPVRWALAILTSILSLACALFICQLFSIDLLSRLSSVQPQPRSETKYFGNIHQYHEYLGWDLVPNSKGRAKSTDYDVIYTIDADKCRSTPDPIDSRGIVFITGGSYTFGVGVNDEECYPYILGSKYWPDHKIKNRAVNGWGTVQAYQVVSDALRAQEKPCLVLYSIIPHHRIRNYLRKSWFEINFPTAKGKSGKTRKGIPYFELRNGKLVFQGAVGIEAAIDDGSPLLEKKEIALTIALIKEMHRKCSEKDIPFVVVVLPGGGGLETMGLESLRSNRIPLLDLSYIGIKKFHHDPHPNASDHSKIAIAIARSFITELLYGKDLHGKL